MQPVCFAIRVTCVIHIIRDSTTTLNTQTNIYPNTQPYADVSNHNNEIDKLVYALYDLTAEEIAIVEGNV